MRNYRPRWRRLASVMLIGAACTCISSSVTAQSEPRLGTVFYQVLGADKQVTNLPNVPASNKGIQSVLRIATPAADWPSGRRVKILSTQRRLTPQNAINRTCRTQLAWDGQAWVGSTADRTGQLAKVLSTKDLNARANRKMRPGRRHPMLRSLLELQNRRAFWRMAAIDIEAKMFERAGTHSAGKKRWDLALVREIQRNVDDSIGQHRKALAKMARRGQLGKKFKLPDEQRIKHLGATGKVVAATLDPQWTNAAGISKPIKEVHIPPHRLQVWATEPQTGRRIYHVTMAHAEAGTFGAFYYVAYADLTGDGLPDTPIARSTLAESRRPGQWTAWSFTTEAERVFVGRAWPNADTAVYYRRAIGAEWRKLGREVYTAPVLGMSPSRPAGPHITNCRVYSEPAPLEPTTRPAGD